MAKQWCILGLRFEPIPFIHAGQYCKVEEAGALVLAFDGKGPRPFVMCRAWPGAIDRVMPMTNARYFNAREARIALLQRTGSRGRG